MKKHAFFGEIEMYCNHPRSASAKIMSDTELVVIRNPTELEQFTNDNNWLAEKLMKTMGSRLAKANNLLIERADNQITPPAADALETVKDNSIRRIVRH